MKWKHISSTHITFAEAVPDSLYLSNSGRVSSSSVNQGKAGDININSGSITLDNQGFLAAISNSGDGGNINLTASEAIA